MRTVKWIDFFCAKTHSKEKLLVWKTFNFFLHTFFAATSLNQYLPKLNNNVRPKRKERINVNLSQFVSNDIPFVPSRQISLLPSLREVS